MNQVHMFADVDEIKRVVFVLTPAETRRIRVKHRSALEEDEG